MTPEQVGPWLLMILGSGMLGVAIVMISRGQSPKQPWPYVFGLASLGCGIWGPGFLDYYSKLAPLLGMQETASAESYAEVFKKIADGTLPAEYQELAVAYALDRPIENMDQLLESAIQSASSDDGKAVLDAARQELRGKKRAAMTLAKAIANPPESTGPDTPAAPALDKIDRFDSSTRMLIARPMLEGALPEDGRPTLSDDAREKLKSLAAPRRSRVRPKRP